MIQPLSAQEVVVRINDIKIEGNKKTKEKIILRELSFQEGDKLTIKELQERIQEGKNFLLNTALFNFVNIKITQWDTNTNDIDLLVDVKETWYIYPIPVFELEDIDFNVWWKERGRSLDWITYGLDFVHINTTGQQDKLKLSIKNGIKRNYAISYNTPYINKEQNLRLEFNTSYSKSRRVNYITRSNKQVFYPIDETNNDAPPSSEPFVYDLFSTHLKVNYRPAIRSFHNFTLGFKNNSTTDSVAAINPDFFLEGRNSQRFLFFQYKFVHDIRDFKAYPIKGHFFEFKIDKEGFGIFDENNDFSLSGNYNWYLPLKDKLSARLSLRSKVTLHRNKLPQIENKLFGFGEFKMPGFQLYVIDGHDVGVIKSSIHYNFLNKIIKWGKFIPIKEFRVMPLKVYLSLSNDLGYVNNPYSRLSNTLDNTPLWGGGLGLDFVMFNDKVFRAEYTLNHLGEHGLFFDVNLSL